jgi:two-component system, LytTR family, response regulator LytT
MNIKIVIIEDENLASSRLKRLLNELDDNFEIIAEILSVKEGKNWFSSNQNTQIDLIFSDIELLDGLSFEIFDKIKITRPIIFTTAFDKYLLNAFKTFGIEYLLKPFSSDDLEAAVEKFKTLNKDNSNQNNLLEDKFKQFIKSMEPTQFPTFISYIKERIIPIKSENIAYFSLSHQCVYAHTENKKWLLTESLNQIQEKLPQHHFFRANRQYIIQKKFIKEIDSYFNGRLKVELLIENEEILISKDNCKDFKDWLQK